MSYGSYNDPTGRTEWGKQLWKQTNELNAAIEKGWRDRREEERRLNRDSFPGPGPVTYGGQRSGGGFFWLAVLAVVGGVLLYLF